MERPAWKIRREHEAKTAKAHAKPTTDPAPVECDECRTAEAAHEPTPDEETTPSDADQGAPTATPRTRRRTP